MVINSINNFFVLILLLGVVLVIVFLIDPKLFSNKKSNGKFLNTILAAMAIVMIISLYNTYSLNSIDAKVEKKRAQVEKVIENTDLDYSRANHYKTDRRKGAIDNDSMRQIRKELLSNLEKYKFENANLKTELHAVNKAVVKGKYDLIKVRKMDSNEYKVKSLERRIARNNDKIQSIEKELSQIK